MWSLNVLFTVPSHSENYLSWHPGKCCFVLAFPYIPITPHPSTWVKQALHTEFVHIISCRVYFVLRIIPSWHDEIVQEGKLGSPVFSTALFLCSYIPPLIENSALPEFSCNKELLFPGCVHICLWGQNLLLSLSISTHVVIQADSIWEVDYGLIALISFQKVMDQPLVLSWETDRTKTENNVILVQCKFTCFFSTLQTILEDQRAEQIHPSTALQLNSWQCWPVLSKLVVYGPAHIHQHIGTWMWLNPIAEI